MVDSEDSTNKLKSLKISIGAMIKISRNAKIRS